MANESGTKLACESCGSQVAVTAGGSGQVQCCGKPMTVVSGKRPATTPAPQIKPVKGDDPYYD